jgi:hypothetical protein
VINRVAMARHKILLKHNWEETDWTTKRQKSWKEKDVNGEPDLIDLELATKRRAYATNTFFREMDQMRTTSIWLYRTLSSFAVILMVISILYACSNMMTKNLTTIRTRNKQIEDSSIVSRKMRTNMTHEEYMSSLPYDAFVRKVEEQIRQKNLNASFEANQDHVEDIKQHGISQGGSENIRASKTQTLTDDIQASKTKVHPARPLRNIDRSSEPGSTLARSSVAKTEDGATLESRSVSQPPHFSNGQPHDLGYGTGITGFGAFSSLAFAQPLAQSEESPQFTTQTGFSMPQLTDIWLGNPTKMAVPQTLYNPPLPQMHATIPQHHQISPHNLIPNPFVTQSSMVGGQVMMPGQQLMTMPSAGHLPFMGTAGSLPQFSQVVPSLPQVLSLLPKLSP